ncbi:cold shock domain-containing protein [Tychonema sp. LEGE 07199]|uniref:cold-shock protein n=1 Tax=unclassified Tychonema TaxID=2642144 RepID=UPI001881679E|nr:MULTISPECIES: cold shock domain-containing protein [unclassified Tychonema]MBE9121213.1 cold shock domain-containing protein [Tychonema sp. LEGE 07199]MBE9133522.1 cold shock domain-containing protein [Tychonema sp. LEGE 07196]
MTIDFGSIKGYNPDRGFGFVGHTFFNPDGKVFFHIKKIRRKHPELAQKLDSGEAFETFNFWYEIETTEKGEQVSKLWLNADHIPQSYTNELCGLNQKVESIWKNIGSPKPSWLDLVTIELVGVYRKHELSVERDNLESQLRAAEEEQRREAEALLHNEIVRIAKKYDLDAAEAYEIVRIAKKYDLDTAEAYEIVRIAKKYDLDTAEACEIVRIAKEYDLDTAEAYEIVRIVKIARRYGLDTAKVDEILSIAKKYDLDAAEVDEILKIVRRYRRLHTTMAYELYRLLKELGPLGFTHSGQLSIHIRRYQLGYRYPTISGIVTMEDGGTGWEFTGGFPPGIYTIICQELRLANQGTSARAIHFESFQEIYSRNQE